MKRLFRTFGLLWLAGAHVEFVLMSIRVLPADEIFLLLGIFLTTLSIATMMAAAYCPASQHAS